MQIFKNVLKFIIISYLIYIFVFSVLIFALHKSTNKEDIATELSKQMPYNRTNDRVALIEYPEDAINVRLSIINNAQSHIDISYYKLTDGKVSNVFLGSLLEAADRGVKVRILLDGLVQLSNIGGKVNNIFLGFETHPNIELKLYEPVNPLLPLAWNNRLHDKIILVDNKFGLTGGRNIEDRFYLMDDYKDSFVKDRDVLLYHDETEKRNLNSNRSKNNISNSVIDDMQVYYNKLWNHKYSKPKYRYMTNRKIDKGELFVNKLRLEHKNSKEEFVEKHFKNMKTIDWTKKTIAANNVRFISNPIVRYNKDPRCLKTTLQLSSESKNSIFIQSPYIIPSKSINTTFKQYNIDLNKIHLLTNSSASSPNLIAFSGYKNYKKNMIDNGLTIYEYQGPGSIHAKTAIFDQQISIIGTFNIDSRSSYLSTESMVIIDSKEISNTLKKEMQKNLFHSLEVNNNYKYIEKDDLPPYQVSKKKEVIIKIISKITPFFEYLL